MTIELELISLSNLTECFKGKQGIFINYFIVLMEEEIDTVAFLGFTEILIKHLIPKIGQRSKYFQRHQELILEKKIKLPTHIISIN